MKYKYTLFDLDGTLTDPASGITNAIIYARKKWGLEPGVNADYYKFIGPPMPQSYVDYWGFTLEEAKRFLADYREYYSVTGLFENVPYPGMADLLSRLRAAGRKLYVATSKPTDMSVRILERFGLAPYFDAIVGSDPHKPDSTKAVVIRELQATCGVDLSAAVMVGDRHYDVAGAAACGVPCVGVAYGYGTRQELEAAGAKWVADTVEDLGALLLSL